MTFSNLPFSLSRGEMDPINVEAGRLTVVRR
jgi:hypothetical protein